MQGIHELVTCVRRYVSHSAIISRESDNSLIALARFLEFWSDYWPSISGLAKVLQAMRDTDPAADAAWADRMDGLWNACHYLTGWIERDKLLSPHMDTRNRSGFVVDDDTSW